MHRRRVARAEAGALAVLLAAWAALLLGCSSEDEPRGGPPLLVPTTTGSGAAAEAGSSGGSGAEGLGAGGAGGAGGSAGEGGGPEGGAGATGGAGGLWLGAIALEAEPDTACEATSATPALVYSGAGEHPVLDRLEGVGTRWLASDSESSTGFVTFDASGEGATASPITIAASYNVAASEGASVAVAAASSTQILFSRFDASETPIAGPLSVSDEDPAGLILASGAGESVVVWASGDVVRARGVTSSGAFAGAAFDVASSVGQGAIVGSGTHSGGRYAVAWTRVDAGAYVTSFATLTTTAATGTVTTLAETTTAHWLVKLAPLDGGGYAALFNVQLPTWRPVIVVLDEAGAPLGSGHLLLGATTAFDLSVRGEDIGVVARRETNETEFRSTDLDGVPLGPWICLNGTDNYLAKVAAVASSGDGYFILYRQPDQSVALVETDRLGSILR